ncbi:MAG: ribonuclease Z [Chloroherpetonaceae bacterium]|nr:ribonuclease Z [Chthonomonadaceae bacterium]MDW8208344.1 ribonuclease Z [Chloroherpetonaceae bacterium]
MKLTFLGTSAGAPTRHRNVTAVALQLPQRSSCWLFDCGEGTQHQFLRAPHLRLSQIEKVFITHMHGDHLFGLPGLLATRSMQSGCETPVTVFGPEGVGAFVRHALELSGSQLQYPLEVRTVDEGVVCEDTQVRVTCALLTHRVPSWGYAVEEHIQPGRFDVERARALGIPEGPLYGRLKSGETITLPDGRIVRGTDLTGPPRPGRKIVICGDTIFSPASVRLARGADLLVHEATHLEEDLPLARRALHSTARMAAEVARQAGVRRLYLTHFSARYEGEGARLDALLEEARAVFPDTELARDFLSVEVPPREPGSINPAD